MNKGFTLVELISVIAILGLLIVIMVPAYSTINNSVREKNYNSKKLSIKKAVLSYAEKYLKGDIYSGNNKTNYYYFSVDYLIKNGIYSSDSETEEYIENTFKNEKYYGDTYYIVVYYDNVNFRLIANTIDDEVTIAIDDEETIELTKYYCDLKECGNKPF